MPIEQDATISANGPQADGQAGGDEDLPRGMRVGEYEIDGKLGEGGFGAVYKATHPLIGKTAAVKVLHKAFSANGEMVARFMSEARAVNQIRHRNIIDIFSFGQLPDGRHYFVAELLEGLPFDKHLETVGRMDLASALPILRGVGKALDAAHAAGIVHRDLKPENVFLTTQDDGTFFPKLLDFGIAKLLPSEDKGEEKKIRTRTGMQMGTPYYMSPEQCRGIGVDHRTDVYAFGVMVHRVLTGSLPFQGESLMDVMMAHMSTPPPKLSQFGFPSGLDAPLQKMMAKDPALRFGTMIEAVDALEKAARDAGWDAGKLPPELGVQPITNVGKVVTDLGMSASPPAGGSRAALAIVGVVAVIAIAAGGFVLMSNRERPPEPPPVAAKSAQPSVQPTPSAQPSAPPPPSPAPPPMTSAKVTFDVTPKNAEIWVGDQKLGSASDPIAMPTGVGPIEVTVKAPGYAPKGLKVEPKEGASVKATLAKAAPAPGPAAKPLSKDLENPF